MNETKERGGVNGLEQWLARGRRQRRVREKWAAKERAIRTQMRSEMEAEFWRKWQVKEEGTMLEVRMNGFFFWFSSALMAVIAVYWGVNGWPQDKTGANALALLFCAAWGLMFLAVIWSRRVWTKR